MLRLFILGLFLSMTFVLSAQDMSTDRPDQTESGLTVGKGVFQLETGTAFSTGDQYWTINTSLFRYGILDMVELRLVGGLERFSGEFGFDSPKFVIANDFQAGFKVNFIDGDVQLGLLSHFTFPSGTFSSNSTPFSNCTKLAFGVDVHESVSIGANIGAAYAGDDTYTGIYTFALAFGLTERLGFFTEVYGSGFQFEDFSVLYDNGFTYSLNPNLQLDFSFGTGITERSNFYSTGVSWRIKS